MPSLPAHMLVPRIYPAGRAVALFAVCEPELAGRRLNVEGRRVIALPFDRFSLLINYVDRAVYADRELERRRDDAVWQASEARVYERAIERASRHGAVLPIRPLTIVGDAAELDGYVRERAQRWRRSLARLGRLRECAVHLFVGPHAALARDEPYSIRVARRVSRSGRLQPLEGPPAVTDFASVIRQACLRLAQANRRIGPARRGLVWSAAVLLEEGDVAALGKIIARAQGDGSALGITAYLEGPRAPFSFA